MDTGERPSQTRPDPIGGGLLGEEQFDVALLLDVAYDLQKGKMPTRIQACDFKLFESVRPQFNVTRTTVGVEIISAVQRFFLQEYSHSQMKTLKSAWNTAVNATSLQSSHYLSGCRLKLARQMSQIVESIGSLHNPCASPSLRRLSNLMPLLLSRIAAADYAFQCRIDNGSYVNPPPNSSCSIIFPGDYTQMQVIFGRKLVLIDLDGCLHLLPYDQWVMIHNKCVELWLVLIFAFLAEKINFTEGFHKRILALIRIEHKLISSYGNRAYNFHKHLEGFLTGLVIAREEKWTNTELKDIMWGLIRDERLGFPREYENSSLYAIFENCSTTELIELCGTTKLTGHPDIQTELGLKKLYDRTHHPIPITIESILEVINTIKKDFCQKFLLKHKKWPLVSLLPGVPVILTKAVLTNRWIDNPDLVKQYGHLADLDVWNFVTLEQNAEFDWVESHMPFLKDRALAPKYSELVKQQAQQFRIPIGHRRVLLRFLLTKNIFDLTDKYIDKYQSDPHEVIDYLVIKLTQKEKELKIHGRMFGQSPYEERMRRCVMEHNVARLMVDYDPYQSMTTSELQKIQKLLMFRALRNEIDSGRVLQFSIDAEAWNNYFRPELVNAVGQEFFDRIFGVQLYGKTMDTYVYSYIYGISKGEILGWPGQPGGIEGLSQKIWTWIYSRVALRVLESLGYKGYIMVCGDDLRLAVIFPEILFLDRTETDIASDFKNRLQAAFERYGFRMKVSETVASEIFIAYGKVYQVGESFMSSVLKKIAKIHGFQGTTFPLIEQQIASVYSNAHAACQTTTHHVIIHLLAGYVTVIRLLGKVSNLSEIELLEMLCRPSVLGGLPILHLCHFMVRGESDHLTIAVSFAIHLISSGQRQDLGWSLLCTPICKSATKANFLQLLTDPYCLPIDKPESSSAFLKRVMDSHIRRIVKNRDVVQVLRLFSKRQQRLFVQALASMTPCLAKVLAVLWECSPFNILNEVIQKFENSRSIFQLLCIQRRRGGIYRILEGAKKREQKYLGWLRSLAHRPFNEMKNFLGQSFDDFSGGRCESHPLLPVCPTKFTQDFRDHSWGVPVLTITYPCFSDFVVLYSASDEVPFYIQEDHILSQLTLPSVPQNLHFFEGHKKPWIGTKTSEKLLLPQAGLDFEGSISVKISKILKLIEFTRSAGPQMEEVISWVIEHVSGQPLSHFYPMIPCRTGGTITHRLRSRSFEETIMINELPNRSQLITVHHDTHQSLQGISGDFSVNYMAMLLHHLCTILFPLELCPYIPPSIYGTKFYSAVITSCSDCFYDVRDNQLVEMSKELPCFNPLPQENHLIGFTEVLQAELSRKMAECGIPEKHRVLMRQQQDQEVPEQTAHYVAAAALVRESFGEAQEAYELGIQLEYETQRMKLEALHNVKGRTKFSLRDWKAAQPIAIACAMIQECFHWIMRKPELRTPHQSDVLQLPPQLNPFNLIAHKLTSAQRVPMISQALIDMGYTVRPLGALELSQPAKCAKWLHTTLYPIALNIFKNPLPNTRVDSYYSYESDDLILDRINRALNKACISFYQNIFRVLITHLIFDLPLVDAIVGKHIPGSSIQPTLQHWVSTNQMTQQELVTLCHQMLKYTYDIMKVGGIPVYVTEIPFGSSSYYVTGNDNTESVDTFFVDNIERFLSWPLRFRITQQMQELETLDIDLCYDFIEMYEWPVIQVERFGLYACITKIRAQLAEDEVTETKPPRIEGPRQKELVALRGHVMGMRDVRDLRSQIGNTGCEIVVTNLINLVPEYDDDVDYLVIPFSHLTRTNGITITSVVKLHEIFLRTNILTNLVQQGAPFWCACLADGEGGFTNYILRANSKAHVIFNTLYHPQPDQPITFAIPGEVMLSYDQTLINRCYSRHNYGGFNDLTDPHTVSELSALTTEYSGGIGLSLITFDAEGSHLEDNELYETMIIHVICFCLRNVATQGTCVLKTFLSKSPVLWGLWHAFTDAFSYIRLIKPDASHSLNGEFYIVVSNPILSLETRKTLAEKFMKKEFFGPLNSDFHQEARVLIEEMLERRQITLVRGEFPHRFVTWAICNWNTPILPKFTWGIIYRRLHMTAPNLVVDPITKEIIWTEATCDVILESCLKNARDTLGTLTSGQSSILSYTTHTHLCVRLASWCRMVGFVKCLTKFKRLMFQITSHEVEAELRDCLEEIYVIARRYSRSGEIVQGIINPDMPNLRVNLHKETRDGMTLGLRFLTALECVSYYATHDQPPLYPFQEQYREEQYGYDLVPQWNPNY